MLTLLLRQVDMMTIYYTVLQIAKITKEFYNGRKGYNREETWRL